MNLPTSAVNDADPGARGGVRGHFGYLRPPGHRPRIHVTVPPPGEQAENFETDDRPMAVLDAASAPQPPRLDAHGFVFSREPTSVADFLDVREVEASYYDEAARVALKHTGGMQAHVFDHLVRQRTAGTQGLGFGLRQAAQPVQALGRVHNDYTEASGRRRLRLVQASLHDARSVGRYCIVNIWRSIGGLVEDTPLALCDARTVGVEDLHGADIHYANRQGEIFLVQHSDRHRWWFHSAMDRDDVVVFKQYDSLVNGTPRFVPHAAFDLPDAAQATRARRSIEVRVLVVMQ